MPVLPDLSLGKREMIPEDYYQMVKIKDVYLEVIL